MGPGIILKKNEDKRLLNGHQWIFSNEIDKITGSPENGDIVYIFSQNNKFLGKGFYNKNSLIAYRHLTNKLEEIDHNFLKHRIKKAYELRKLKKSGNNSFRLVNSESDLLPGLIIDKYENSFSIQIFSVGMERFSEVIQKILIEEFNADMIIEKNNNELRTLEGLEKKEGVLYKNDDKKEFIVSTEIDGIKYNINILRGQKTGFYLDQVENRKLIRNYITEGAKVLDLFCNEGGFAMNASISGASKVTAVDVSENAILAAKVNSKLNNIDNINFINKDVFEYLDFLSGINARYDLIILDPPSFTKSKRTINTALKGYIDINSKALNLLNENGLLFTFTCSHHIDNESFRNVLIASSKNSGRKIQIIEARGSSYDHPVIPQMKETSYLQGYLLRVI